MTNLGVEALAFVSDSLSYGLSLSKRVAEDIEALRLGVYSIATSSDQDRLKQFEIGGLGAADSTTLLASELKQRFGSGWLVLELPLLIPTDPVVVQASNEIITCRNEVYAVRPLSGGSEAVEDTLRETDPSAMYNAFVLQALPEGLSPDEAYERGSKLLALIVGAYDGEGYLLALPTDAAEPGSR